MDSIDINTLSGIDFYIAKKCDDGNEVLEGDEVSIFTKAQQELRDSGKDMECTINGIKYYYNKILGELSVLPMIKMNGEQIPDALKTVLKQEVMQNFEINLTLSKINKENDVGKVEKTKTLFEQAVENYDDKTGAKLAKDAYVHRNKKKRTIVKRGKSFSTYYLGKCKSYVRKCIERSGLGTINGRNGYEAMADLRKKENFVEISDTSQVKLNDIPDGAILVYYPDNVRKDGKRNGYDQIDGHIEVARKNPKTGVVEGISDGKSVLKELPDAIFIPVKKA